MGKATQQSNSRARFEARSLTSKAVLAALTQSKQCRFSQKEEFSSSREMGACREGCMRSILLHQSPKGNGIPGPVFPMSAPEPMCQLEVLLVSGVTPTLTRFNPLVVLSSVSKLRLSQRKGYLPTRHKALCLAENSLLIWVRFSGDRRWFLERR